MSTATPTPRAPTHEDAGFLERTFAAQQAPLTRYATRLLAGDADRARDVVQDTFVKLMAQAPEAVDGHAVEWLFTAVQEIRAITARLAAALGAEGEGTEGRADGETAKRGEAAPAPDPYARKAKLLRFPQLTFIGAGLAAAETAVTQWRFKPGEVRHFTAVTNRDGSYRSMTGSETTEWAWHAVFVFNATGEMNTATVTAPAK